MLKWCLHRYADYHHHHHHHHHHCRQHQQQCLTCEVSQLSAAADSTQYINISSPSSSMNEWMMFLLTCDKKLTKSKFSPTHASTKRKITDELKHNAGWYIFLLVDACVGLNWLLVSFLSSSSSSPSSTSSSSLIRRQNKRNDTNHHVSQP